MPDASIIKLQIENSISELPLVVQEVDAVFPRFNLTKKHINHVYMILDEVLINIITHAYSGQDKHLISIHITLTAESFTLEVTDDGKEFDMSQDVEADTTSSMDERAIGGMGLFLVQHIVDHISYIRRGGKNVLTLSMNF